MTKRLLTLYVDAEDILLAKSKGINLSQEFRNFLSILVKNQEIQNVPDRDKVILLEVKMGELMSQLEQKTKECEKLDRELLEERKKRSKNKDSSIVIYPPDDRIYPKVKR